MQINTYQFIYQSEYNNCNLTRTFNISVEVDVQDYFDALHDHRIQEISFDNREGFDLYTGGVTFCRYLQPQFDDQSQLKLIVPHRYARSNRIGDIYDNLDLACATISRYNLVAYRMLHPSEYDADQLNQAFVSKGGEVLTRNIPYRYIQVAEEITAMTKHYTSLSEMLMYLKEWYTGPKVHPQKQPKRRILPH